jgi:hypothetical protein
VRSIISVKVQGRPAVRPPFRHHGGGFLFDLTAGSLALALEKDRESTRVSEATYGKKHAENHEAQYSGTLYGARRKSERIKGELHRAPAPPVFNISEDIK